MGNWVNWVLVIGGVVCVIAELALGVLTGFDLALVGGSLAAGGIVGLLFQSAQVGLLSAAALALLYLVVLRSWLKAKLHIRERPTNVDAVVGKTGVVMKRVAPREPGMVKVGSEVWRAELVAAEGPARDAGAVVTVESVEGVTLRVR